MLRLVLVYSLLLLSITARSQPVHDKIKHTVVIDTDCAIDDFRAISLLLSRPEITVKGIILSDGSLQPAEGLAKVAALLHTAKKDSIALGCGEVLKGVNPHWRPFVQSVIWGTEPLNISPTPEAETLLKEILVHSEEKITLVCLGPLTNESRLIRNSPSLKSKVERIIWYNESLDPYHGFNYECDTFSANQVLKSGIRIDIISNLNKAESALDTTCYNLCKKSATTLSGILYNVYGQTSVMERLKQGHFRLCDDLLPVYMTNPELFDMKKAGDNFTIRYNVDYDIISVKEVINDMIRGTYVKGGTIVFSEFPQKPEMYTYDVRQIMDSALARYGIEEWKANVMTDEFHGHLGVFSIVGAKMGTRAREIFGVGPDMLKVTSFAGSRPPYSCLNDGIQVSTGATLGMGTIQVSADTVVRPAAIFSYKGRSVQLALKAEYLNQVDADINEGIVRFGLADDGYWKLIRRNAINYWLNWDRNEIFDITETDL